MNNNFMRRGEAHQRFSLRKLSIGVASVLLGTTFMVFGTQTVQANSDNTIPTNNHKVVQVDPKNTQKKTKTGGTSDTLADASQNKNAAVMSSEVNEQSVSKTIAVDSEAAPVIKTNASSDKEDVTTTESSKITTITKDDVLKVLGYANKELSDEQLAKLGITRNTYIKNGILYTEKGSISLKTANDKEYKFTDIFPLHHEDGSMYSNEEMLSGFNWDSAANVYDIINVKIDYAYAPIAKGGTIYVNKGETLDTEDAYRGLPTNIDNTYKSVSWEKNNPVDINKAGEYEGTLDVVYKSGLGQSVGIKVVVVDLKGKNIWVHVDGEVPSAEDSVTGFPAGSTNFTWIEKPKTSETGKGTGKVSVTYPDGTKGTTDVTVHVLAPQVPPTIVIDKGSDLPDPVTEIKNADEIKTHIPGDTEYTWNPSIKIDTNTPGETKTEIITHWPDGTTTTSPITVVVKNPQAKDEIIGETTLNRKVKFVDTNDHSHELADPVINSVKFELHMVTDENGKVSYKWTPADATFPSVAAKKIQGWIIDENCKNGAPAEIVTTDSLPIVSTKEGAARIKQEYTLTSLLTYHRENGGTVDPGTDPVDSGTPDQPVTPENPETPTNPNIPNEPSTDDNHVTPLPTKPDKASKPKKNRAKDNNGPIGSAQKTRYTNTGLGSSNTQALVAANKTAKKATLPQTGSKQNGILAAVGAAVAAIGGLFGLASRKKRF